VLLGDLVLVNASVESESLVALDKKTGREVWRARGVVESWATPCLVAVAGGKTEVVVPIVGKLLGFDPATGKQLWSCATDIRSYMVPTPVAHDGVVYCIGGRSGGALAVRAGGRGDVTRTHRLWTGRKWSNVSSPVYHEGHLYWAHDNTGTAYCGEAKTGKVVYEQRLDRAAQIYGAALQAGGRIHYLDRAGRTYVVAAKPEFELIAVNDLRDGSTFNASPTAAGGKLFIRSDRALYALQSR
jgi:outer membrane protein assembly factor BamB